MCTIILLENHQKKSRKKCTPANTVEIPNENKTITDFIGYMASEVSEIQNSPWQKPLEQREQEDQKEFAERYNDVLAAAPRTAEGKLRYFANVMLNLLPFVFHGRQKNLFFSDFSMFYLSEFDAAYFEYHNNNENFEKEYPFRFTALDADSLENAIQDCLWQIINSNDKPEIMWQASRIFELYHNMLDYFSPYNIEKELALSPFPLNKL